ncbi:MAG: NAD-dependent epimerase/dehydratase family protein [Polyangiaceae bacterium]
MRYLVTGGTGFLGAHLVRALRARDHEVVILARNENAAEFADDRGVVIRRGDVLDGASVRDAAAGCVGAFHLAGRVSRNPDDAEDIYRTHVEGTKSALEACRNAGVKRVVIASSSGTVAVSDDPDHVSTETDETPITLIARWPYYRAKLFAERAALEQNSAGFEVVSINPTLLLGPGDTRGSSTEDVRLFLERKIPAVPPGGISFVDVRDAAEGAVLAMDKGEPGERYLLGAANMTLREFFAKLERASGVKAPWIPMPRAPELAKMGAKRASEIAKKLGLNFDIDPVSLDMAQFYWYLDASRAEQVLGWSSREPAETLTDTVDDLRNRGVVWPEEPYEPAR